MKIEDKVLSRLAELARLEFGAEEKKQIEADLERVLGFVDKLKELDTTGVAPLIYMSDEVNVLRTDTAKTEITHQQAMQNAPKKDSDYFRLPKVIE